MLKVRVEVRIRVKIRVRLRVGVRVNVRVRVGVKVRVLVYSVHQTINSVHRPNSFNWVAYLILDNYTRRPGFSIF